MKDIPREFFYLSSVDKERPPIFGVDWPFAVASQVASRVVFCFLDNPLLPHRQLWHCTHTIYKTGQTRPLPLQPTGPVCLATKPASHECKTYIRSVAKCYPPRPLRCQFCCPRGSHQSAFLYRNYWQNLSQSARTAYLAIGSHLNLTDVVLQRLKGNVARQLIKRDKGWQLFSYLRPTFFIRPIHASIVL